MTRLIISCQHCAKQFPSPLQMDLDTFHALLGGNSVRCPYCEERTKCSKENMMLTCISKESA